MQLIIPRKIEARNENVRKIRIKKYYKKSDRIEQIFKSYNLIKHLKFLKTQSYETQRYAELFQNKEDQLYGK